MLPKKRFKAHCNKCVYVGQYQDYDLFWCKYDETDYKNLYYAQKHTDPEVAIHWGRISQLEQPVCAAGFRLPNNIDSEDFRINFILKALYWMTNHAR